MPIGFATENHETLLDVEHIIGSVRRKYPNITYVQMPCVNDHPDFCQMVASWADGQIEELLSEQALSVNRNQALFVHHYDHNHKGHDHHHHHDHDHNGHHHHHH
jgi:ferrochelatase